ncbi:MAG: DUF4351 domain-containing protein [Candidatus Accumulibacter sp.]|uniref:DUF4351 domain-containing protein n=1 Tax=Candidatus Accumulibacter cognatus TaxID=2954383 RepID=A0A080MAA1_9PROT|nr:MAG: hypothetical protein AW06_001493 [Candidatus Accumulibacter cognatus]MBN8516307.1 DUF4351 domain-containing protein [Accumulibacter sp.]MBO3712255.1 DUF4351 domain-containing protein [Accumulibacter sp.]QLH50091.1 MAG: DUF4351 domain-containing protein [Candidatus Accumulibacter cognatus]
MSCWRNDSRNGRRPTRPRERLRGKAEGEALALQKLLKKRFGAVPSDVLAKISAASLEQIDAWLDLVLDARSLDDIFGPTTC